MLWTCNNTFRLGIHQCTDALGGLVSAGRVVLEIKRERPNIVEAVRYAKSIGLPLVAHLTIHWSGTIAFDDHDGLRFAKVREGLSKVLLRRGIPRCMGLVPRVQSPYRHRA